MLSLMLAPVTDVDIDEPPMPPPWRGVRRLATILVGAGALCVVVWIIWWRIAETRLRPKMTALRAAGEPILLGDFRWPTVDSADNAATYWNQSVGALNSATVCPSSSNFTYPTAPRTRSAGSTWSVRPLWLMILRFNSRQKPRSTAASTGGRYPFRLISCTELFQNLSLFRDLAMQLADAAMWWHFQGNDRKAIERIKALFALADDVTTYTPNLVGYLVSIGIRDLGFDRLQIIAGDLRLAVDATSTSGVPRASIERLIAELNSSSTETDELKNALQLERADVIDTLQWAGDSQPLLRPMFQLRAAQVIDIADQQREQAEADRDRAEPEGDHSDDRHEHPAERAVEYGDARAFSIST